ncbi:unnamed protein product [Pedinophyceae sp. YPF-701]|nr:unnamed protein product [Pedinophyceae sp. YPF-701]
MDPDAARAPAGADAAAAEKEETLRRLESEVALWGSACSTSDAMIGRWVDELGMVEVALARGAFRDTIGVQKVRMRRRRPPELAADGRASLAAPPPVPALPPRLRDANASFADRAPMPYR